MQPLSTPVLVLVGMAVLVPFGGCATYSKVGAEYRHRPTRLTVKLPSGWLRYHKGEHTFEMTRDGLELERIWIDLIPVDRKLPGTERTYQATMLPHEIAELSLARLGASDRCNDFTVTDTELAEIAGLQGFKARAEFKTESGLLKNLLLYGMIIDDRLFQAGYEAAAEVYFNRFEPAFEGVVESATVQ